MRYCILFLTMSYLFCANIKAQEQPEYYKTTSVNKKVAEYTDVYDLKTPLKSFITFSYLLINGKEGMLRQASASTIKGFMAKHNAPDKKRSDKVKNGMLNKTIKEMIVYKDSVACVISDYADSLYSMRYLYMENGSWLNVGEDLGNGFTGARNRFIQKSPELLRRLRKIYELQKTPSDTIAFINYLKKYGKTPKAFIINTLAKNKIVIYGELHNRKNSWALLKDVIKDPAFYKTVGTVFMEISSDAQSKLDKFYKSNELKPGLILDVLRNLELFGWMDKGMYEFLIDVWKLNKTLPDKERIKVIATDIPRPFDSLLTKKQYDEHFNNVLDRNRQMADIIEEYVKAKKSKKNNFFIVGLGHAYKSSAPGFASAKSGQEPELTAGALLNKRFSNNMVFSIFSHCPIIGNDGSIFGKKRNGLFDYVFAKLNNRPIAFNLKGSPFGKEPCDAVFETMYDKNTGNYENNYDGYIFLEPLDKEPEAYMLLEIFTDDYVKELKRRANMLGEKEVYGCKVENLTKEGILSGMKTKLYRWDFSE